MDSPGQDLMLTKLREQLNTDKIKLWLPPYTTENRERGENPEELIKKYSSLLKFPPQVIATALEDLRLNSLAMLEEKRQFQTDGIATLRVKLSGAQSEQNLNKSIPIECNLNVNGQDLKHLIAAKFDVQTELLKVICKGKVIQDKQSLNDQGVRNGSNLMAMCMTATEAQITQKDKDLMHVQKLRKAAEMLSKKSDDDEYFNVQIADQKGQPIDLPIEEKKALTIAMTLHEKGRAVLKDQKVTLALPLLLEADEEFSKCRSQILDSVDNYGILCLDIVWCYFMLKNLEQLPNAETRLNKTKECFEKSYGAQMERLAKIKGGTGSEQALFMRLYLLQGIVAFHQGNTTQARQLLARAQFVLSLLHVDTDKLNEVMTMGFTEKEARLGLRAKNGNIQAAVDHIMQRRKEKEEIDHKVNKDWKRRIKSKKLGKTASGLQVNIDHYENLVALEFPKGAAAEALRQTNNNFDAALEFLRIHPELFSLPDPEDSKIQITDQMITQIVALGFSPDLARLALERVNGNLSKAVDAMLQGGVDFLPGVLDTDSPSTSTGAFDSPSTSTDTSLCEENPEEAKRRKKENKELKEMLSDIEIDEEDHLDLTLKEEREALELYSQLMESLPK